MITSGWNQGGITREQKLVPLVLGITLVGLLENQIWHSHSSILIGLLLESSLGITKSFDHFVLGADYALI